MGFTKDDDMLETASVGIAGGLTAAFVGHPFDTIKTRLQTGTPIWSGSRGIVRSLFRGLMSPVLAIPPSWVVNFATYGMALGFTGDDSYGAHFLAGSLSGVSWAFIITPFELIKYVLIQFVSQYFSLSLSLVHALTHSVSLAN